MKFGDFWFARRSDADTRPTGNRERNLESKNSKGKVMASDLDERTSPDDLWKLAPNGHGGFENDRGHQFNKDRVPVTFDHILASYIQRAQLIAKERGETLVQLHHLHAALSEVVQTKPHLSKFFNQKPGEPRESDSQP